MTIRWVIRLGLLVGLGAAVRAAMPDIQRYLKIRAM